MQELTKDIQTHTGNKILTPTVHTRIWIICCAEAIRFHSDTARFFMYTPENMEISNAITIISPCCRNSFPRETETSGMSIRIAGWSPFLHRLWDEKYTDILQPDSAGRLQSAGCGNDKLYDCTGSCTHDSGRFAGKEKR